MTPKEKAKVLYEKMRWEAYRLPSKSCALVAVEEIIKTLKDNDLYIGGETNIDEIIRFWQEVKQEIEKL